MAALRAEKMDVRITAEVPLAVHMRDPLQPERFRRSSLVHQKPTVLEWKDRQECLFPHLAWGQTFSCMPASALEQTSLLVPGSRGGQIFLSVRNILADRQERLSH